MSGNNEIGLHPEQIEELTAATPKESIQSRPSPWGGEIEYVTGEYVKRKLMKAFNGALRVTVRNIETVDVLPAQGINVYYILRHDTLVLTKDAVDQLEARLK